MSKIKIFNTLLSYLLISIIFNSCFEPNFEILQPDKQSPIQLEEKHEKKLFGTSREFDLRITNTSDKDLKNCQIVFDNKYSHTLLGLHAREKGMIKDSVFKKGEQYLLFFGSKNTNIEFFKVDDNFIHPEKISIKCDECEVNWKTD